jgi:2-methylcitrate dehydratase PrpD
MNPDYVDTILSLRWQQLPPEVQAQAKRCLKDILAVAAASRALPASLRWQSLVEGQYGSGPAPLWFTGCSSTLSGSCLFNAAAVDSLDWHDGFRPVKGHAGATVVPLVLGSCALRRVGGEELLTALAVGYEIACRAGLVLHLLYRPVYHASGSWASIGAAAAGARILGIPAERFDSVLGTAEYYAPISPMMRVIDNPASVKDSAAAGALAAATALSMEEGGLTGPPSLLRAETRGAETTAALGREWLILKSYFKPYPTCRWSQPAVEAALRLQKRHGFTAGEVEHVHVETFAAGARLTRFPPEHSDDAQYSTPWAVAAALVDGTLGVAQVHPDRLLDPEILEVGGKVTISEAEDLEARFPDECLVRLEVTLGNGRRFRCPTTAAPGDWDNPLSREELDRKFAAAAEPVLGKQRSGRLARLIDTLEEHGSAELLELVTPAAPRAGHEG